MPIRVIRNGAGRYTAFVTPPHTQNRPSSEHGPFPLGGLIDALRAAGCHTTDISDALYEVEPDWPKLVGDAQAFPPPWLEYPDFPYPSIDWRMGEGEAYMDRWCEFFERLSDVEAEAYMRQYPEPTDWKGFYARRLAERKR